MVSSHTPENEMERMHPQACNFMWHAGLILIFINAAFLGFVYFSKPANGATIKVAYQRSCWLSEKAIRFAFKFIKMQSLEVLEHVQ